MSVFVLNAVLWIFGIRGHIPHHDDFGAGRDESPFAAGTSTTMRALATVVVAIVFLALALWVAVWLAIKLL